MAIDQLSWYKANNMYILVRKNKIHETGAKSASSKTFADYNAALVEFYQHLSNNTADKSVERFDITILSGDCIPCKTEHFARQYPSNDNE